MENEKTYLYFILTGPEEFINNMANTTVRKRQKFAESKRHWEGKTW